MLVVTHKVVSKAEGAVRVLEGDEERAYRDARRRANARVGFMTHLVAYGSVCIFLLFVSGFRPAFIVALSWGIGIACHSHASSSSAATCTPAFTSATLPVIRQSPLPPKAIAT